MTNENRVLEMYASGSSGLVIAREIGINCEAVYRILRRHGATRTNKQNYAVVFEDNYFENIDTPEKAYFLGLIAADGCVMSTKQSSLKMKIDLESSDHLVLDMLAAALKLPADRVKYYKYGKTGFVDMNDPRNAEKRIARLVIPSDKLVNDLIHLGIKPKKSLSLDYPNIDSALDSHFIRGYFDGDGTVTTGPTVKICGTEELLLSMQSILVDKCEIGVTKLTTRFKERNNNSRALECGGRKQVKRIFDFLYKESTVHMDRKYSKFMRLLHEDI